jgi:hypothetical protein
MAHGDDQFHSLGSLANSQSNSTGEDQLKTTAVFQAGASVSQADVDYVLSPAPSLVRLGRYVLEKPLGRGGFGEVWKAFDPDLHCHVAIKFARRDRVFAADKVEEFLDEGRKLARLRECAGIVTVYDVGISDGMAYIVSELVEGGTLAERIEKNPPSLLESVELVAQIADALHQAHLKDFIHRDLKPGNILLRSDGEPVIADFGLAITEEGQLSEENTTLGTVVYMSPEQAAGHSRQLTPATDIYSLGVILFQLLTGRLPYVARNPQDYREQTLTREPRPPRTIKDEISPELERVCLTCLARNVNARYTTAADLGKELRKCVPQASLRASALAGAVRTRRLRAAGLILLAGIAVAALVAFWNRDSLFGPREQDLKAPRNTQGLNSPVASTDTGALPDEPFQKLASNQLVPFRWYELLRMEPETLSGPRRPGAGKHYDQESESLTISTPGAGMFRLGTLASKSYRVRVEFKQPGTWQGSAGVFFGVPDQGTKRPGQMVVLMQNTGPDSKEFPILVARLLVDVAGDEFHPSPPQVSVPHTVRLPRMRPGQTIGLELSIVDGNLNSVKWGHQELSSLCDPKLESAFAHRPVTGQFGLVNWLTRGVTFERPEIRLEDEFSASN